MPTVAVYGASGFTGRLVLAELARRGIDAVACGRDARRLRATGATRIAVAGLGDAGALRAAFEGATVVANCAGPFHRTGEPVLRAAAAAGAHYLDTTGERPWMRRAFGALDAVVADAGVAAVPAMGFDYLPGDLLCALVGRRVQPLAELVVVYDLEGFAMTRGTLRSGLEMLAEPSGAAAPAPRRAAVRLPAPAGRQAVVPYPGGEVVTAPRHLRTPPPRVFITARSLAPAAVAGVLGALLPLGRALMATPLRAGLERAIGRLPEGPDEASRRGVRWAVAALARGEHGRLAQGRVSGSDVYGLTAATIAEGVQRLAAADFAGRGTLAPAEAFDAEELAGALDAHGVRFAA